MRKCVGLLAVAFCFSVFGQSEVLFLGSEEAVDAVLADSLDPYFSRMHSWEMVLKTGRQIDPSTREMTIEECREAYRSGVREFTDDSKAVISWYVQRADSAVTNEFPALASIPWKFILLSDSIEAGFPHTREGYILLSESLVAALREWREKQSSGQYVGMEILIHEKMHVLQRMNPAPFERFYQKVWGFRKVNAPALKDLENERFIVNPDASTAEWVIKIPAKKTNYILPAIMLKDNSKGMGGNIRRVGISVDSTVGGFVPRMDDDGNLDVKDLDAIVQYRRKFPQSEHDYHPHELSADLVSKYLVMHYLSARFGTASVSKMDYSRIERLIESFQ